jgi:hypothetical protein
MKSLTSPKSVGSRRSVVSIQSVSYSIGHKSALQTTESNNGEMLLNAPASKSVGDNASIKVRQKRLNALISDVCYKFDDFLTLLN